MELELEPSDAPMPRSRPVKRLSDGELAELRAHLIDLLDRGWIQHSTAGHAAAVVFARKPDGSWRFCYDSRGLNAITRPAVKPSTHCSTHADAAVDSLLDATWNGPAGRHGQSEETHEHYNGVAVRTISPVPDISRYASNGLSIVVPDLA